MRSWHDYDEALIERGCAILDLGSLVSWREELEAMNQSKLGRPFEFPNSYISFLAFVKVGFDVPYRTLEGITRELEEWVRFVEEMHYTHMRRRILASMKGKKPSEIIGKDADGDDSVLRVQARAGRDVEGEEVRQPEGGGVSQGHVVQQVPLHQAVGRAEKTREVETLARQD